MEAYSDFASVYDELMDNTPYEEWKKRIIADIETYGISKPNREAEDPLESERNLVLDLACGTGTLTELLYQAGYDMIGVDYSDAMLAKAIEKRDESGSEILYLQQDMRELELYCTVGTVISVCDSLNYLLAPEELKATFELVHNYLYPGGLFLFDVNTEYKYREVIGDSTIAENRDDCSFIWENFYDAEEGINEYDVTIYVQEEGGLYRRFEETHYQRGYRENEIRELLSQTGFELLRITDSDTGREPGEETERLYVAARCIKPQEETD